MKRWIVLIVLTTYFPSTHVVTAWLSSSLRYKNNLHTRRHLEFAVSRIAPTRRRDTCETTLRGVAKRGEVLKEELVNGTGGSVEHDVDDVGNAVCRVVAWSDGKIPSSRSMLPAQVFRPPYMLSKLDTIYHAVAHAETSRLKYTERRPESKDDTTIVEKSDGIEPLDKEEESKLVSTLRSSLEDAGFELLTRRDLDLCEALNAGYLLRLSILPDVSKLDPEICNEFYPERFFRNGTLASNEEFLFDGRVLVFRRGYSSEVTKGRLLLPKLDYLQAGLVQSAASFVTTRIGKAERQLWSAVLQVAGKIQREVVRPLQKRIIMTIPSRRVATYLGQTWGLEKQDAGDDSSSRKHAMTEKGESKVFKLSRYGGSNIRFVGSPNPSDALMPFLVCEVNDMEPIKEQNVDHDIYEKLNQGIFSCQHDAEQELVERPAVQLLKRISISNVVDLFSKLGRSQLVQKFFEKSQLVEPTFEEVVVVWRNLPKKPMSKPVPPKVVYDVAEIFAVEDRLPKMPEPQPEPAPLPLEIRAFDDVPMANLPAVLPKTRLVFRPADAFVFDLVSIVSLAAVFGTLKFDNPKLDLLAIVSVTLWFIRTFFRYKNKFARYDLLVNKFLTSKIAHRGAGALKYIATEAGSQRGARASVVYSWLLQRKHASKSTALSRLTGDKQLRSQLVQEGRVEVNELIRCDRNVDIDVDAALDDLEDLGLISFSQDRNDLVYVCKESDIVDRLRSAWNNVFDGNLGYRSPARKNADTVKQNSSNL